MNGWVHFNNILQNPHCLVAGTTGSGKSTLLDGFIWTLSATDPKANELVLIDPKRIDLRKWKNLPHVLRYETELDGAINALDCAIAQMNARYRDMAKNPDIEWRGYYIVIDELADLMLEGKKRVLPKLQKILQLGRGCNMHLVCATQAPSRKVIPAELTLNFTDRIALRCVSAIESRQIINQAGAENLPRYGEALYLSPEGLRLLDCPKTDDEWIEERINYWNANKPAKGFLSRLFGRG